MLNTLPLIQQNRRRVQVPVVGELVTLAASNVIPDAEDQPGSSVTGEGISPEAETLAASSKDTYLSYLKLYKEFCDNKYAPQDEGRYEVYVFKVLAFFKDFMFKRKVTKVFRPNEKKDVKVAVALYKGPGLRTNFEVQPLGEYLKQVPADPDTGSKTLEVYCGSTVMDVTLKALVHLQTRQKNRIVQPNLNVPIRRSAAIKDALQQYNNSLIFADFHSDRNLFDFAAGENARPERGLEALEEQTNRLKELLTRLESKMDYMMSLLNPPAVGFGYGGPAPQYYPMVVWQACGPSSPSSQQAWGHPGYSHAPPEVVRSQPDGSRSDAAATSPSRPPVPAQKNVSDPARWVPIAPSVRPSVTTSHPQQGPMSAQPQSATTMMTTPTTTPTTGPTTIPTTIPAIPTTLERMIERFIVPKKHQTVDEICADHQAFTDERKKVGKKKEMGLSHAQEKQINNKKRVIEEVQYLADQINAKDASLSQEEADKMAMAHLDKIRIEQNLSVNALVKYCRDKRDAREKSEASEPDSD
ncbi:hypothetical protein BGX28_003570 [Mortierella sp. GBA30]|nr:hypothetical protein BGX28_003570 [Mortierella sp. GBA30]